LVGVTTTHREYCTRKNGHCPAMPSNSTVPTAAAAATPTPAPPTQSSAGRPLGKLLDPAGPKYQVVFVTAEVAPWSQTGGLGAVADGLPVTLAALGHRVMSIAPRYDQYADAWDTAVTADLQLASEPTTVRFFHTYKNKVDRLWVDHPAFLEKVWGLTKEKLYGPKWGIDYTDNQARFAMFAQAVLAAIATVPLGGYPYGEDVIILCNDWHSSLVPLYLDLARKEFKAGTADDATCKAFAGEWKTTKTVFVSHNMVYQGRFPLRADHSTILNVPQTYVDEMSCFMPLKVGKKHPKVSCLNWMMGAFKYADQLLTVSPGYGEEIGSGPIKGVELDELAAGHKRGIVGILNGLKDNVVPYNAELKKKGGLATLYTEETLERKLICKAALQKKFDLPVDPEIPVFCFLGRYDVQKGIDIMFQAFAEGLLEKNEMQVIIMGSGTQELLDKAIFLEEKYPTKFKAVLSFKGAEKFQVYAGADFALVPSRYEPCGLVQMEAMRFGTVPVVSPTGGLNDTVKDLVTGILLERELDPESDVLPEDVECVSEALLRAVNLFADEPETILKMRKAGMKVSKEFTWKRAAKEYEDLFASLGGVNVQAQAEEQRFAPSVVVEAEKAL